MINVMLNSGILFYLVIHSLAHAVTLSCKDGPRTKLTIDLVVLYTKLEL